MEGGSTPEVSGEAVAPRTIRDPETGKEWVVSVTGRSGSGILPLRSVPIMEVTFSKVEDPGRPLRRAMVVEEDLEAVPDPMLLDSFRCSRPYTEPLQEKGDVDRRGRRGKGRRSRRS
jgi:hypothetical protein